MAIALELFLCQIDGLALDFLILARGRKIPIRLLHLGNDVDQPDLKFGARQLNLPRAHTQQRSRRIRTAIPQQGLGQRDAELRSEERVYTQERVNRRHAAVIERDIECRALPRRGFVQREVAGQVVFRKFAVAGLKQRRRRNVAVLKVGLPAECEIGITLGGGKRGLRIGLVGALHFQFQVFAKGHLDGFMQGQIAGRRDADACRRIIRGSEQRQ